MVTDLSIDSVFRKSFKEFFRYAPFYILTSLSVSFVCTLLMYLLIHFLPEEYLQFLSIKTEKIPLLFSQIPYPLFVFMVIFVSTVIMVSIFISYLMWMYHAFTIKRTQHPPKMVLIDMLKNKVFFKGLGTLILYVMILVLCSITITIPVCFVLAKYNLLSFLPISIFFALLPAIFLGIRLFAATFIAFEGKYSGISALRESFNRTDGYCYQISLLLCLTFFISTVISGVLYLISILAIALFAKLTGTKESYSLIEIFLKFRFFLLSQKSWLIVVGSWLMWAVKFVTPAFGLLVLAEIYSRISIPDVAIIHRENHSTDIQ